jgi:hypothetical protein
VVWRQLGDLVSATTALGLHRQTETGPVTFLSEMKKRMITIITCLCLGSSLLTGRPPALNYRFTRFSLPLAITDDALIAGPERIREAIQQRLDENGWDRHENLQGATTTRARGCMARNLSEILELYLGDPEDCTSERIQYVFLTPDL